MTNADKVRLHQSGRRNGNRPRPASVGRP